MRCIGSHRATEGFAFRFETTAGLGTAGTGTWATTGATRAVFANMIETTQFACFIIHRAVDVIILYTIFPNANLSRT